MATSQQQLAFAVRAVNEASATLKQVQGDIDGIGEKAERGNSRLGGFGSALGKVASIAGGFVVAQALMQLPGLLIGAAQAAADDEAATMRMDKALKNLADTAGGQALTAFGQLKQATEESIAAGQQKAFTDDEVRESLQKLIASTGDFGEAQSRSALAMDLARGAGIPLAQASTLLGKVTEENVNVFKRMGITMKEGASEADVLATIQAKFGGQADAYAKSTAGQFDIAKIRIGEAKEAIGGFLLPIMAKLVAFLAEQVIPKVEAFIEAVGPRIQQGIVMARQAIEFFTPIVREHFAKFMKYYEESIKPAQENIEAAFRAVVGFIRDHWPEIMEVIGPVIDQVKNSIETAFAVVTGLIDVVIKLLGGDFSGAWSALGGVVEAIWNGIERTIRNSVNVVRGLLNTLIRGFNAIPGVFNIPEIPAFAAGGVMARSGLALVGERGPEVVALPGGSRVYASGTGPSMGGGMELHYHQEGPVFGMLDLRAHILEAVRDGLRDGAFRGIIGDAA